MPTYGEFWLDRFGEADQIDRCDECGAVVVNPEAHDAWHAKIDRTHACEARFA